MGAHLVSSQIQVLDDLPHFSTCIIDNKLQGTKKQSKNVFLEDGKLEMFLKKWT